MATIPVASDMNFLRLGTFEISCCELGCVRFAAAISACSVGTTTRACTFRPLESQARAKYAARSGLDLPASGRCKLDETRDDVKMLREIMAAGSALLIVTSAAHAQTVTPTVNGTILKIDQPLGKITLRHGEVPNLHMEAMTMVFAVRDSAMLDGLKAGDKVRFEAEEINGKKTVTEIQSAR